jgi:hypothetical protein
MIYHDLQTVDGFRLSNLNIQNVTLESTLVI